ncbi:MAG: response regulator [Lachnospiraceae bacterium]|nr:response regulator [Lachnospiraceae bacterium]
MERTPTVLVVDDEKMTRVLLAKMIEDMGYSPLLCDGTKEAFEQLNKELPDLIVSDVAMPEMDGYQFCELVKKEPRTKDIPFIFVSAVISNKEKIKGLRLGAVDYITKPYVKEEVQIRIRTHMKLRMMQEQLEQNNYQLNVMIKKQMQTIENSRKTALVALAKVTEGSFIITTENHLGNISYNSKMLAQALAFTHKFENQISDRFIELIEIASMIHDIGKIAIPQTILEKPEELTEEEIEQMQLHPLHGKRIFDEVFRDMEEDDFMIMSRNVVMYHHERFDGTGYPYGLKGEEIPLEARIVALVDVYDTLRSEKCYKQEYTFEEAKERMETIYKGYFDPDILEIFWMVEKRLKKGK